MSNRTVTVTITGKKEGVGDTIFLILTQTIYMLFGRIAKANTPYTTVCILDIESP